MKILICGSRDFNDYVFFEKKILEILKKYFIPLEKIEIVSGHARGADLLAENFAKKFSIKNTIFPADWELYGKSAGFIRNAQMIEYILNDTGLVVAFWDGKSNGTRHTINLAKKKNIETIVIKYK